MMQSAFLVEDNILIRDNLISVLADLADVLVIASAATENAAKSWLSSHNGQWDLCVVDLFLEQGSGLGVLAACRDREPHQRVLVLTNYATLDTRRRCLDLGADMVFDKSTELDALLEFCTITAHPAVLTYGGTFLPAPYREADAGSSILPIGQAGQAARPSSMGSAAPRQVAIN